jgi:hypothetical protein
MNSMRMKLARLVKIARMLLQTKVTYSGEMKRIKSNACVF